MSTSGHIGGQFCISSRLAHCDRYTYEVASCKKRTTSVVQLGGARICRKNEDGENFLYLREKPDLQYIETRTASDCKLLAKMNAPLVFDTNIAQKVYLQLVMFMFNLVMWICQAKNDVRVPT